MRPRATKKLLTCGLGVLIAGCLWFALAPTAIGGSTTYVVTDGISMQPRFHAGDLVLVRSQSSYRVGEIVAYNSRLLDRIVLHRIIGRAGSRYIFKGDNNNFIDFEHPAASQLIGALWLHIPGAGARLRSLHAPALMALLLGLGTLLLLGAAFTRGRRRRRRQRRAEAPPPRPVRGTPAPVGGLLAVGLLALLPFLALALLAFTRPARTTTPLTVPYGQSGALAYSARATPGPAYADDRAVTGDPLFAHVLRTVQLSFSYAFRAASEHSLRGTASLGATVVSTSGWKTAIGLAPPRSFRGDHALINARLDLTSLLALLRRVETATAVTGSYTLTFLPRVTVRGTLAGEPLRTLFAPRIDFSLNQLEAEPVVLATGQPSGPAPAPNALTPSSSGALGAHRSSPTYISLQVARLTVASARVASLMAIAVIVCAVLAGCVVVRRRQRDAAEAIRARYGRSIVSVERVWPLPGVAVIDLADIDALARIAEHYDRSILHEYTDYGEAYWVTDESGQFRYAVIGGSDEHPDALEYAAVQYSARPAYGAESEHGATDYAAPVEHAGPASYQDVYETGGTEELTSEVYMDELQLGGAITAFATDPGAQAVAPDTLAHPIVPGVVGPGGAPSGGSV